MARRTRRTHSPAFKAKVTLAALKGCKTASNSFHPGPCDHPAVSLENLGCCLWI
jgi:hypothetical protein